MNISEIELPPELINLDTRTFNDRSKDAGIREAIEYPDTNDYYDHPICGNKPLPSLLVAECFCGTETLSGAGDLALGDSFCCVSPEDECYVVGTRNTAHFLGTPCVKLSHSSHQNAWT